MAGMSAILGIRMDEARKLPAPDFARAAQLVRTTLQSRGVNVTTEPVSDITLQMDEAMVRLRKRFPDQKTFAFKDVMEEASRG